MYTKGYYRDFNFLEDVYDVLFLDVRDEDKKEVQDFLDISIEEGLRNLIMVSTELKVIVHEEKIIGVFGVSRDGESQTAEVYLILSDDIQKIKFQFLRESREVIKDFLSRYDILYNYISSENKGTIKWLEWLGFKVIKDNPIYFENPEVPFYYFYIER